MISFEKILIFFVSTTGFAVMFCDANILISNTMKKEEQYRMDLEIFEHMDRFHNIYRKAEVFDIYEETGVTSDFKFFIDTDDNVKELIHYMDFIGTSGSFFDSLTLSYSILYTKYTAMFYAVNMLNIYKIKKNNFETWTNNNVINNILKENKKMILDVYLKIGQYLAWYATIGNDVLFKETQEKLSKKNPCAENSFKEFKDSFNRILSEMNTTVFHAMSPYIESETIEPVDLNKFWTDIYIKSASDIQLINRYFTALFSGAPENNIEMNDFVKTVQKESFISNFVSDLSIMKGRDIEETYSNFDNEKKKELYEANVTNMMMVIEDNEMESISEGTTEKMDARERKYIILQPLKEEELYTCLQFQLKDHEIFLEKKKRA